VEKTALETLSIEFLICSNGRTRIKILDVGKSFARFGSSVKRNMNLKMSVEVFYGS
jgi:hypothetical protein